MPPLHLAPEMAGFVVFDDATVRIYSVCSAETRERMPSGKVSLLKRRK